jgi:hypothetical protein
MARPLTIAAAALSLLALPACADQAAPLQALSKMPVKEITVFKDGHAFVLHAGKMPTDAAGNVVMDYLPSPVLGTFWPYCGEKNAKLQAVTAGQRKVLVEHTALTMHELIEANLGADVVVTEVTDKMAPDKFYPAKIVGRPTRSGEELEKTSPPNSGELLPQKGDLILLKTEGGLKAVSLEQVRDITIKGEAKPKFSQEEFRNLLTLKLDWNGKPGQAADVGLMYLQKGVRWIPSYKVVIDGKGSAAVRFQATLINEMVNLEDVTVNLVVGVPTFKFKDTIDPIGLQQQLVQIAAQFRRDGSQVPNALSNAIMSQQAGLGGQFRNEPEPAGEAALPRDLGPEIAGTDQKEDLFVYTVQHVTLKKGQRMVLPVGEFALPYKDVYSLDVPFTPPPEAWGEAMNQFRGQTNDPDAAKLMLSPKVMHKIRLTNNTKAPLTTAPGLVVRDDRVLAQGLVTYTPIGADSDLTITTAVDIMVRKKEKEAKRTPDAVKWQNNPYARIDLEGQLTLTNRKDKAVEVEVARYVLGNIGEADQGGKVEMVNVLEDPAFLPSGLSGGEPYWQWWRGYNWPYWWYHFNGIGKATWKVKLDPGKGIDLKYTWNYYWR